MGEVEIIGWAGGDGARGPRSFSDGAPLFRAKVLTLCEAALLADRPVDELKRAIREGRLRATRRGWWRIERRDLDDYLRSRRVT